jgi:hypothetical protein
MAIANQTTATVIPALQYRDAPAAIDFLRKAFGFEKKAVYEGEGGAGTCFSPRGRPRERGDSCPEAGESFARPIDTLAQRKDTHRFCAGWGSVSAGFGIPLAPRRCRDGSP